MTENTSHRWRLYGVPNETPFVLEGPGGKIVTTKRCLKGETDYFVGGTTKLYGAALFRMRQEDFGERKHHDGVSETDRGNITVNAQSEIQLQYACNKQEPTRRLEAKLHSMLEHLAGTCGFGTDPATMANALRVGITWLTDRL